VGLIRIVLGILPYEFHALNHNILASILVPFILIIPPGEMFIQFLTCGHVCDSNVNTMLFGLYQENLDMKPCISLYIRASVLFALSLTYCIIIGLEYKRRNNTIQPVEPVDRPQLHLQQDRVTIENVYSVNAFNEERTQYHQVSVYKLANYFNFQ
jgi:hypothetical protein